MSFEAIVARYDELASRLDRIIADAEHRITTEPADVYFVENANFLTKSFLISLCCYLEVFLKEIANAHLNNVNLRLLNSKLPHNLLAWSFSREVKDKDLSFKVFELALTPKEIDDELSGNPFRTAKCFKLLGVDLEKVPEFVANKDMINSVVAKRNNIIHHNDAAVDLSLGDIRVYSSHFSAYIRAISSAVESLA